MGRFRSFLLLLYCLSSYDEERLVLRATKTSGNIKEIFELSGEASGEIELHSISSYRIRIQGRRHSLHAETINRKKKRRKSKTKQTGDASDLFGVVSKFLRFQSLVPQDRQKERVEDQGEGEPLDGDQQRRVAVVAEKETQRGSGEHHHTDQ